MTTEERLDAMAKRIAEAEIEMDNLIVAYRGVLAALNHASAARAAQAAVLAALIGAHGVVAVQPRHRAAIDNLPQDLRAAARDMLEDLLNPDG